MTGCLKVYEHYSWMEKNQHILNSTVAWYHHGNGQGLVVYKIDNISFIPIFEMTRSVPDYVRPTAIWFTYMFLRSQI